MGQQTLPCADCDAATERFRRLGFTVHGCAPHPQQPGMCIIRFDPPGAAATPARAMASEGAAPAAAAAAASAPAPLTETQARTARAIVNLFETGHLLGDYGQVTVLRGDPGRLTYGRSQTTLGSGLLEQLLQRYLANPGSRFGERLRPWLPLFADKHTSLDTDRRLHNLLRACADDPVMRDTQDAFFDRHFWQPAQRAATRLGVHSALSVAVVYDGHVHGSWTRLRDRTTAAHGSVAQVGERAWIDGYVELRRQWLAGHSIAILRNTVYRMAAFQRLIELDQWGLPLPLVVRDAEISLPALNATPPGCYDGPMPGTRTLTVTQPLARGLDVRLLQLALSDLGADVKADGVFGTASAGCVREVQIARGLPATGVADPGLIAELVG